MNTNNKKKVLPFLLLAEIAIFATIILLTVWAVSTKSMYSYNGMVLAKPICVEITTIDRVEHGSISTSNHSSDVTYVTFGEIVYKIPGLIANPKPGIYVQGNPDGYSNLGVVIVGPFENCPLEKNK